MFDEKDKDFGAAILRILNVNNSKSPFINDLMDRDPTFTTDEINELIGLISTFLHNKNAEEMFLDRLNDNKIKLSIVERFYLSEKLAKKSKMRPGRPINIDNMERMSKIYIYVFCLTEIDGWGKDSAKKRASEIFSCSPSTIENYISKIDSIISAKSPFLEEIDEFGNTTYELKRNVSIDECRVLGIAELVRSDINFIKEILIKQKNGYVASDWTYFYAPPSTTSK